MYSDSDFIRDFNQLMMIKEQQITKTEHVVDSCNFMQRITNAKTKGGIQGYNSGSAKKYF